ncbi:peptidyl-prolyl cis-trans isomerase-like 4 [Paramacrobiotus metropolitanus]|uniref:peptidyl-prolyl cis-trans isomerase-like 4 n=1 Tax=Paramacrobiotus metropolitanus TaxID=2943436 RepID=UPI0024455EA1|nr:peptidyl-prolyl cis-trans isomerase-like 4 [Paramacrobiotus metropolitanus]
MAVILETTLGDITIDLLVKERPRACMNFLKLCKIKYYNYSVFFNVQRDFIAQTGDPTGTGKGGESVFSKLYGDQAAFFEPESVPVLRHIKTGTVSMADNGHNMHGSQFFITLGENLDYLDGKHTVFGEVSEGLDVLQKMNESIVDDHNRPYRDIMISHTVILDDPFPDPTGLNIPERSPSPTKEQLESMRLAPGESAEEFEGLSKEEMDEVVQEKEAGARAKILEMIGDLPDADIKPPDNVLFVCKLNPVTTDDDLFIIFSRYGPVKSCEVIRDKKSGESLQYAFIEFEEADHCANAYFKMDNVLIDDRRIHVDFSQSVSKLDWMSKWKQSRAGMASRVAPSEKKEKLPQKSAEREGKNHSKSSDKRSEKDVDRRRSPGPPRRIRSRSDDKHTVRKSSPSRRSRSRERRRRNRSSSRDRSHKRHSPVRDRSRERRSERDKRDRSSSPSSHRRRRR